MYIVMFISPDNCRRNVLMRQSIVLMDGLCGQECYVGQISVADPCGIWIFKRPVYESVRLATDISRHILPPFGIELQMEVNAECLYMFFMTVGGIT